MVWVGLAYLVLVFWVWSFAWAAKEPPPLSPPVKRGEGSPPRSRRETGGREPPSVPP